MFVEPLELLVHFVLSKMLILCDLNFLAIFGGSCQSNTCGSDHGDWTPGPITVIGRIDCDALELEHARQTSWEIWFVLNLAWGLCHKTCGLHARRTFGNSCCSSLTAIRPISSFLWLCYLMLQLAHQPIMLFYFVKGDLFDFLPPAIMVLFFATMRRYFGSSLVSKSLYCMIYMHCVGSKGVFSLISASS